MWFRVLHRLCSSRFNYLARLAVLLGALSVGGCATVSYYAQAVNGQLNVMASSRPISEVIADRDTESKVRQQLEQLAELRQFASETLHLADTGSYRDYADLNREAMVWSIVAAPIDSLEPRQWCYPVVGCASYRGYFSKSRAQAYAQELAGEDWDVAVEPVPAYSTLGWFNDPLPSTVIHWPLANIAGLLFHELAHETLYVRDDSAFNEAYATLVEREGVRRWLARHGSEEAGQAWRQTATRRTDFLSLLRATRQRLEKLYYSTP